jgi:predicted HicB family RNase H-like nuclease
MSNTISYSGYTASLSFDTDDKLIVGRVLDIDDIITFHGESVAEFEAAFHVAVDGYIAACQQLGSAPEKPDGGKMMLRVAPTVRAAELGSAARSAATLNRLIDQTAESHQPILLAGKRSSAVLLSEEDWKAIQETLHLLSVPGMLESIKRGMAEPLAENAKNPGW